MIKSKAYKIIDQRFDDWESDVDRRWIYDDFLRREDYKHGWISITSLANDEKHNQVYVGIGSFDTKLLYTFDHERKTFTDLEYQKVADPYDAKFHCSLEMDDNGELYGALAQFHDLDKQFIARGGRIVKYSPAMKEYTFLGTPVKGAYIQSIAFDRKRRKIYGFTLSPEYFFEHDLITGTSEIIANIGNSFDLCQPHNPVIDDDGNVWGTYGITRAFFYDAGVDSIRLFKYDPARRQMEFFKYGLPRLDDQDKGKVDRAINIGDGYLYFGGVAGSFSRLDPKTGEVTGYGKPCPGSRLAGLCPGKDGFIYGVGGDDNVPTVFRFDPKSERTEVLGRIFDEELQEAPVRIHAITVTDNGVLYCGENDHHHRSSYLWEVELKK